MKDDSRQEERLVWRLKKKQILYDERWLHLESRSYQLADGTAIEPYYVTCPNDFTVIVAVTESGNFLMERLYRPGAEMVMTEPPAGAIEPGEKPEEAAERELREETGYEAESMEFLCKIAPNAATASNYAWWYLARNARPAGKQRLDETEALEVFEMTREQVLEGLRAGEFIQAVHVAALYRALDKMKEEIDF